MRIKKTSQYIEGGASLSNVYGTSNENGYTQEYINNSIGIGIIENVSNSNGRYIKFADGTMICMGAKTFLFGFTVQNASGGGYSSGALAMNDFPSTFTSAPYIIGTVQKAQGQWTGWWSGIFIGTSASNPGSVEFYRGTSTAENVVTYTMEYIAIGRWK